MTYNDWMNGVPETIIPNERGYKLQEEPLLYRSLPEDLLDNPPMP
jgi:hypothetical protein